MSGPARSIPHVDEARLPSASKMTSGAMARRHGRFAAKPTHQQKRRAQPRKQPASDFGDNIFFDPGRVEAIRYQKQVDELKKEQKRLLQRLQDSNYNPQLNYSVAPDEAEQFEIATAKLDQLIIDRQEKEVIEMRDEQLKQQRLAKINLQAAQDYLNTTGSTKPIPAPFYYTPQQRRNARQAFKRVKKRLFGRHSPFQNRTFSIDVFKELRVQQLKVLSQHIPQSLIQLEIVRRLTTAHSAASYLQFLPLADNPMLRLTPQSQILRAMSRDPRHDLRKSLLITTEHNPYTEFNRALVPFLTNLFRDQTILSTQRPAKAILRDFKAFYPTTKQYFKQILHLSPMFLRRYRLLHSKYRAVRNVAKKFWIYTPHSTDTFDSIKTTPVYFPNPHLITNTPISPLPTQTPPTKLTTSQQAAMLWLEEFPFQLDIDLLLTGHPSQSTSTPNQKPTQPSFLQTKIYLVPRKPQNHTNKGRGYRCHKSSKKSTTSQIFPQRSEYELEVNPTNPTPVDELIITPISKLQGEAKAQGVPTLPPPPLAFLPTLPPPTNLSPSILLENATQLATNLTHAFSTSQIAPSR